MTAPAPRAGRRWAPWAPAPSTPPLTLGESRPAAPGSNVKAWAGRSCPLQSPWWARAGAPQSRAPGRSHSGRGGGAGAGSAGWRPAAHAASGGGWRGAGPGGEGGGTSRRCSARLTGSRGSSAPPAPPAPQAPSLNAAPAARPSHRSPRGPCGGGDAPRRLRCTGCSPPPGANPAGCFMGRTSTLPRGEQREGRVCSACRPLSPSTRPPPSPAPRRSAGADPSRPLHAAPLLPALRVRRRLHVGGRSGPSPRRPGLPLSRARPRSPRAGNLRLLSRGCATAGPPVQVRASAAVDPADNMGRWLATRGPAAAGSRGSPPPEGARVAQGTGNTPGRQARGTGSTGTDSRAASAGRGRARGLRNASHTQPRGKEQGRSRSDRVLGPRSRWRAAAPCPPPPGGRRHPEV